MSIELFPYVGAGPLRFGMAPEEVRAILGPPIRESSEPDYLGEAREAFNLGYIPRGRPALQTIVFLTETEFKLSGSTLTARKDLEVKLKAIDDRCFSHVGFLLYPMFGLAIDIESGYLHAHSRETFNVMLEGISA